MLVIPYSFLPARITKKLSYAFFSMANSLSKSFPFLNQNLVRADFDTDDREYIAMCIVTSLIFFVVSSLVLMFFLKPFNVDKPYLIGPFLGLIFSCFVFFQQISYPGIVSHRKVRDIERNLMPALQSILVQIESGVPLFNVLVNISKSNYGKVSDEFSRVVKEINSGKPQLDALSDSATRNPSMFYRRALWQVVNGMKSGATISNIMRETINSLSEEQIVQIQSYGSQLNPLAMFYMLIAVIVPALSITLIIVLSSFVSASSSTVKVLFWGLYASITFFQIIFMGLIKSRRPNLMSD